MIFAAGTGVYAQDQLEKLELEYKIGTEKLQKPLDSLRSGYKKRLEKTQAEFAEAGDLNGVLGARDAASAGDPEPDKLANIPKIAELQKLFLEEKSQRLKRKEEAAIVLKQSFLDQLRGLHDRLNKGGDASAAKPVHAKIVKLESEIAKSKPAVPAEIEFVEDLEMTGSFYSFVNATASFYINGKKVQAAKKGESTSAPCELKVGDSVVFSLHNGDGGRKRFKTAFMSDDKAYVVSFPAKDLKVIPDGDKRRSITALEFSRMTVLANTRSHPGESAGIPFNHSSEWVWDHGNNAILATIIRPEMIRATGKPPKR
jgi:hypothetical protein